MKKILKILLYIVLALFIFIGIFIALFMYAGYSKRKNLAKKRMEILEECNKDPYITKQLGIDLIHFNDSEIDTLTFEVIRNNTVVRDTTIIGTTNDKYILSVDIPFKKFQIVDTIAMTTSNGLKFYISNFKRNVNELYGMFGPVALTDCFVMKDYTINGHNNIAQVDKYYAILETENNKIQRISTLHPSYKKLIKSYAITEKKVDSIGRKIYNDYHKAGEGSDIGLEITPQKSYYLKRFTFEDNEGEIIKINTQTGKQSKRLKNYPIENEF